MGDAGDVGAAGDLGASSMAPLPPSPMAGGPLGRARVLAGWGLALLGPPLLTFVLSLERRHFGLTSDLLFFLTLTVGVALVGGLWPAVAAAVAGFLLLNWFFTPPFHTFTIAEAQNALALAVFVAVAVAVASVVDLAARRTRQAARSRAEAETLSLLATSVLRGENALPALLRRVRDAFGATSVTLLERTEDGWATVASVSSVSSAASVASVDDAAASPERDVHRPDVHRPDGPGPEDAETRAPVRGRYVLALRGRAVPAADRQVLSAFASQAAAALEWQRLAEEAAQARSLAEGNKIRTALLAAVSHDLRTPLASIKASVSSLRQGDVEWDPADEAELLATIEESADRLDGLIANLLDMSRLQTGGLNPLAREVALDEVTAPALAAVPTARVEVDVPETLPAVVADPGLLERALANVVENAVRHSDRAVLITAGERRFGRGPGRVELRVADHGPGVPDAAKQQIFAPFQRLGDAPKGSGVGLGLAVARGFVEAIGGTLEAEDTPGGGLTMVFSLPIAEPEGER